MNATISPEATAPLVEFIYEAIAVLESDLIMISANGMESMEDIASFKQRYPFAFQGPPPAAADAPTEQPHPPEPEPQPSMNKPSMKMMSRCLRPCRRPRRAHPSLRQPRRSRPLPRRLLAWQRRLPK